MNFFGNTVVEAFIKFYPSGTAKIMLTFNCIFWFSLDKHIVFGFKHQRPAVNASLNQII